MGVWKKTQCENVSSFFQEIKPLEAQRKLLFERVLVIVASAPAEGLESKAWIPKDVVLHDDLLRKAIEVILPTGF